MVASPEEIRRNIESVREQLAAAAKAAGRDPAGVALMGVSKFQPIESIYAALDCGLGLLGENRVQERDAKKSQWNGPEAEWHMIGHLQKNKARRAVELFDCVESVDSLELALVIERAVAEKSEVSKYFSRPYPIMIEVNTSGEDSKQGVKPEKSFAIIDDIRVKCPHVEIRGLMTIGPLAGGAAAAGRCFALLRELRDEARARSGLELASLSMGMSGDYAAAIREGSTIIRVGTAIFGSR
jgi:pyridoxal phosphate enzyme (YggS family)